MRSSVRCSSLSLSQSRRRRSRRRGSWPWPPVSRFPKEFAGKPFVLALAGSAVLRDVNARDVAYSDKYGQCPAGVPTYVVGCQLISGTVPVPVNETTITAASLCFPWEKNVEVISVSFSGTARINSSPDWAHRVTSLPYLGNPIGNGPDIDGISALGEADLGSAFGRAELSGCQFLNTSPAWTDSTTSWPPTIDKGDFMMWNPDDNGATLTVVSTGQRVAWEGNMLLAVLGIAGGAFLTLAVATYRSGMALRRHSKAED